MTTHKRRGKSGLAQELNLPPNMEARRLRNGNYSYRVLLNDGSKVNVGWNLQEAMHEYLRLRGPAVDSTQAAAEIWQRHKKSAAQRGLAFELTVDDVREMLDRQGSRCALTQRAFSNEKPAGQRIRPWAASIDRKDATKGYSVNNCRLVCASVNVALNRFGDAAFMELLESMVRRIVREELALATR